MVRTIEDIPNTGVDDLSVDDAVLMFYKTVLAFDHLRHQIHIISNVIVEDSREPIEIQYNKAIAEIQEIESLLRAPIAFPTICGPSKVTWRRRRARRCLTNVSRGICGRCSISIGLPRSASTVGICNI